ncbi:MAG: GntR family transcriptional regulator [Sneathiellaceae bacterium]
MDDNFSSEPRSALAKNTKISTSPGKPAPRRNSQIDIVAALEHDIVSGLIKPNQRLDERELAQRFQVSRTPVREALNRLVSSGIVEYRPRQGMFASAMTMSHFLHMYEVMAHLEALCANLCARRMVRSDRQALSELHASANAIVETHDGAAYSRYNLAFHDLLYRGARNPVLEEQVRAMRRRLEPYRSYSFELPNRARESYAEHSQIIDFIMRGEGDAAERNMRNHMDIRRENFSDLLVMLSDVLLDG